MLCYLGWMLAALDQGRVILIDEIDAKLHFLVADYLIKLFNSIDNNPKNAQLICTAHNVMLMDEDLRRDQIYFTSKTNTAKVLWLLYPIIKTSEKRIYSVKDIWRVFIQNCPI